MKEIWKDIPGFIGYKASNYGRIGSVKSRKLKIMKVLFRGYRRNIPGSALYIGGKQKSCLNHRLVASAFIGPRPNGMVVIHRDNNLLNNRPSNLCYATQSIAKLHSAKPTFVMKRPDGNTWYARVCFRKRFRNLGVFTNKQDAIDARNNLVNSMIADATNNRTTRCARA
jgi:hypothetical protein